MPTGNFDEPLAPPPPPPRSPRSFRLPAAYYSAPLSEVRPIFPAWVPWGCGSLAGLALLVMFAGGAMLTGSRLGALIDLVLGMTVGEMKAMYGDDITAEQKESFDTEVKRMRDGLRDGSVTVQEVQPFLQSMQKAIGDEKVSPSELDILTGIARKAAGPAPAPIP